MAIRPSERSKQEMKKRGYLVGMAEQWVLLREGQAAKTAIQRQRKAAGGFRKDLHGFIDVHCLRADTPGVTAVQATTRARMSGHLRQYRRTATVRETILAFLAAGNTFLLHGWLKVEVTNLAKTGTYARWQLTEREITAADMVLSDRDYQAVQAAEQSQQLLAEGRKAEVETQGDLFEPPDVCGKTKELFH